MVRIGWGYDIHRLFPGRRTVLGGVDFPDFPHGFDTHSDGDVVAHAIIDAIAGALAVGSLARIVHQPVAALMVGAAELSA
jgi:2-C-methyl-D-erythritol 2,4-cyclodiphosphate synthase